MAGRFAVAAALLASAAAAEGRPLEAELPPRSAACWERVYGQAHLAAHPRRQVTRIRLVGAPEPEADRGVFVELQFALRKRANDRAFDYKLDGFCRPSRGGLRCEPGWDAGVWRLERAEGGKLLVRNEGLAINPADYDAEDVADDAVRLPPKPDDQAWLLDRSTDKDRKPW